MRARDGVLGSFVQPGLRRQLAGWIALLALIGGALAVYAVYTFTDGRLRGQVDSDLKHDVARASSHLTTVRPMTPAALETAAKRYVDERGPASGQLLAVGLPAGTVTNAPARSAPDKANEALLRSPEGYSTRGDGEGEGGLRVLLEHVSLGRGVTATFAAGESLGAVARTDSDLGTALIVAGLVVVLGAMAAATLIAAHVSRPLRRMAAVAEAVNAGDLEPRIELEPGAGIEVRVLAEAFNGMLGRLEEAFETQQAFIADASHEMRTPLTVIRGQIEVLAARETPSSHEIRATERVVADEIARMNRLVDDLRVLAESEQPRFVRSEPMYLRTFIEGFWSSTRAIAERNFELGPVPPGILLADEDRLAQALRNLLANAVRYTAAPDGTIRMTIVDLGDGRVRFTVDDDGPGIAPGEHAHVFERFYRVAGSSRHGRGSGLGLAIVSAIAEGHGGTVRADESPLGGARIELELPNFPVAAPAGDRAQPPAD